jgi:hypothetical protein
MMARFWDSGSVTGNREVWRSIEFVGKETHSIFALILIAVVKALSGSTNIDCLLYDKYCIDSFIYATFLTSQ